MTWRTLAAEIPRLLEEEPGLALDQARAVAVELLERVRAKTHHRPPVGDTSLEGLLGLVGEDLPQRVRVQLQAILAFGSAKDASEARVSKWSKGDILPCLQALENVIRWYLDAFPSSSDQLRPCVLPNEGIARSRPRDPESRSSSSEEPPPQIESEAFFELDPFPSELRGLPTANRRWLLLFLGIYGIALLTLFTLQVTAMKSRADKRIGFTAEEFSGGVRISGVDIMSPAEKSGLKSGDVVLEVDGHPITSHADYPRAASEFERDTPVRFLIARDGETIVVFADPGIPMNWATSLLVGVVLLCCLVPGALILLNRSRDERFRLLGLFFLLLAFEITIGMGGVIAPWIYSLQGSCFFLCTGLEIGITLHLVSIIPARNPWIGRHPRLVLLFYGLGVGLGAIGWLTFLVDRFSPSYWLPWSPSMLESFFNFIVLPTWTTILVILLARPALRYPDSVGRIQAKIGLVGLFPWIAYNYSFALPPLFGLQPVTIPSALFPPIALSFPVAIGAAIYFEAQSHRKILLTLARKIRQLDSIESISALICQDLETAFHPESLHIFFQRDPAEPLTLGYRTASKSKICEIPPHFALLPLAEKSGRILLFPRDLKNRLPEKEQQWLRDLGARLIVPVNDSRRDLVGLLLLGDKRSEGFYSEQDFRLLHSLAGQIALSFENIDLQSQLDEKNRLQREVLARLQNREINLVKECLVCGTCFDSAVNECSVDGSEVVLAVPVERLIDRRYRLDKVLGKGGIGSVYEATDLHLDRRVAVKVLLGSALESSLLQRRFAQEARVVAQLNHPNIVTIFDYGQTAVGNFFIILELLRGTTLRNALRRTGAVEPGILATWFDQILEGLAAAHALGVVHRDLKPGNVFIVGGTNKAPIKLLDFGIAKIKTRPDLGDKLPSLPGVVLGTIGYMAPEQVFDDETDERADIYSVGVMVLEALLGRRPFSGRTQMEVIESLERFSLPFGGLSGAQLEAALRRCLARDPADRFPSVADLRQSLLPALRGCASAAAISPGPLSDQALTLENRGPTEKIEISEPVEAYFKELRDQLKGQKRR